MYNVHAHVNVHVNVIIDRFWGKRFDEATFASSIVNRSRVMSLLNVSFRAIIWQSLLMPKRNDHPTMYDDRIMIRRRLGRNFANRAAGIPFNKWSNGIDNPSTDTIVANTYWDIYRRVVDILRLPGTNFSDGFQTPWYSITNLLKWYQHSLNSCKSVDHVIRYL